MSTIEPVLSSTILSSHLVLNIWSSKFQICFPLITVIFTSINWSPLLGSHNHLFMVFHITPYSPEHV